tara:strand:+ start:6484 stop:6795 length:312 start_codon:yes stop_codon:yes gene_type:complete
MKKAKVTTIDPNWKIGSNTEGLFWKEEQTITPEFLNSTHEKRVNSAQNKANDWHQIADIPISVIDQWKREGFDIFDPNVKASEIVKRLKNSGQHYFLTTDKRI